MTHLPLFLDKYLRAKNGGKIMDFSDFLFFNFIFLTDLPIQIDYVMLQH
jgi:hypothetical protein